MALMRLRPDLKVEGVDIVPRPRTLIPVTQYDGITLPFADKSVDYVTIVDVLHHTTDPDVGAARGRPRRAAGRGHQGPSARGLLASPTLTFMDWFGNFGDGVPMPYEFLTRREWQGAFFKSRLADGDDGREARPLPASGPLAFDRQLHFVALMPTPERLAYSS